jgi:antitoxin VapB
VLARVVRGEENDYNLVIWAQTVRPLPLSAAPPVDHPRTLGGSLLMSLHISNTEVEALACEMAQLTGESKTEAVRRALLERRERMAHMVVHRAPETRLRRFLEREVWTRPVRGPRGEDASDDRG